MLKNISWQSFLFFLCWMLPCYYCVVAILYYRKDLEKVISSKRSILAFANQRNLASVESADKDAFELARSLRNDIATTLQKASVLHYPKEELVMALQLNVREYPELQQSAFQVAINHYISQESEKQCSTSLSDEELRMIWLG